MSLTEELPSWSGAAHARNLASAAMRVTYRLHPHGAHHADGSGAALLLCPNEGLLAGALVHATVPRPVHVVANAAMMAAIRQGLMTKAGVIPVREATALAAQRAARAALLDDRAVAITGSLVNPAYLLGVTGVPIVPVVMLGAEGRVPTDPPRPRTRIDVYFFDPVHVEVDGDPRRAATRSAVTEQVRQVMTDAERAAAVRSGRA